ncbi:hypothetical protein GXP67_34950 [Rhodocytophaga rosea]|uniref:Uncharacterized protein n=1 Tax=Rhodocytophaga rosea TaxID=2704465 RepID=A0A6C0GVY5_9BACT|nr:hypothetical protein [Rhodocytophaga rosea]QHT71492.1 hypothetical protein GXP67_34950 [Rhodocytophaga rosea]
MQKKVNFDGDLITCDGYQSLGHVIEIQENAMVIAENKTLAMFERAAGI